MMTPDEHAGRALAELDREGLSPASAADAPRIRAVVATAIRAALLDCARLVEQYDATDEDGRFLADLGEWVGSEPCYLPSAEKIAAAIRAVARDRQGGAGA
jgi:hypothetical protein